MGELREKMRHALVVRGMAAKTQSAYLDSVRALAKYYGRRPDELSTEEIQRFVRYLIEERKLASASVRLAVAGMRFFYGVTLGRERIEVNLPLPRAAKKLPEILSREEVARILEATTTLRERVLLMATYGGGLRVSEVVRLEVRDLDAERGLIRVVGGKGLHACLRTKQTQLVPLPARPPKR